MEKEEIEKLVARLAKQGISPAKIGLILRDNYGVFLPKEMKIKKILEKEGIKFIPDIDFLKKKLQKIRVHYEKNKQDKKAKQEMLILESRIAKLEKMGK